MTRFMVLARAGCSLAALLISSAGWAQGAGRTAEAGASVPPAVGAENESGVADIVVTANKREQNLSKVGASIAALGADALARQRISTVADLAQATPGLVFAPSQTSTPVYTLRGVGFFESTLAAYPDVSLYIDQAPLPLPIMSSLTAFDLQRVEVLKGPQGTLFGNNATGGAINFVAARPTRDFEAGAEFTYARFNTFEASGFVSGPITETLRARLAVKVANGDEWQKSYTRVEGGVDPALVAAGVPASANNRQDRIGKTDNIAGRLILDWDASDDLTFSLNLNGWRDQSDPTAPQKFAFTPQFPSGSVGFFGTVPANLPMAFYPDAPRNARAADWTPRFRPFTDNRFKQGTLRADYDFGGVVLTSLTGYSELRYASATDGDGTGLISVDVGPEVGSINSLTQEIRLSNGGSNPLRWVVGANYERTNVTQVSDVYYADSSSAAINAIVSTRYESTSHMRNYAGFGNLEFDVTDQITLKAGVRQTKAKRGYTAINHDAPDLVDLINPQTITLNTTEFFNIVYGFLGPAVFGRPIPTIAPFGSFVLDTRVNADGTPVDPSTFLIPSVVHDRLSEDSTSWSVGVDYKPTADVLLFANIAKGYKAGSFPHVTGAIFDSFAPVKQESLVSYEAGFKLQLLDRRLSINGAAFYYDYRDKQLRAKLVDPIFGALDHLVNVPKSTVKGAEIEVQGRPADGLTFSLSATYLDATVDRYDGVTGQNRDPATGILSPVIASFNGVRLPFSPKLQYAARADYDFPLTEALNGFVGAGVTGQSKSLATLVLPGTTPFNAPAELFTLNRRALVNLSAGLRSSDDRWRVTVWGKNVFNKYYWTSVFQPSDNLVRYPGRPAEYGVSVGFRFQ